MMNSCILNLTLFLILIVYEIITIIFASLDIFLKKGLFMQAASSNILFLAGSILSSIYQYNIAMMFEDIIVLSCQRLQVFLKKRDLFFRSSLLDQHDNIRREKLQFVEVEKDLLRFRVLNFPFQCLWVHVVRVYLASTLGFFGHIN